jgi:zinc/manganese transport system substrate-binding protein
VKTRLVPVVALLLTAIVAACGSDSDDGSGVTVTATTGILADITERVAGDDAEVEQLIPDSASPHDFSLSAQDRAEVEDSALLVTNGADLEAGIPIDEIDIDSYALSDHVGELLPFEEAGEHAHEEGAPEEDEHSEEEEHGGEDPHVWMDPTRVAAALPSLADALAEADPEHADAYRRRAAAYAGELMALDKQIASSLESIPPQGRELVTSHDALGYFADRYRLEVVATPFPASGPEAEASAQSVQEVEDAIERTGVPAVCAEESDDPQVLEQIAERTGVEIVDGLLVESPGDAGSYEEMLLRDAQLISAALGN